jgi:hypothetical protein
VGELAKVGFGRREESGYFGRTLRMSPTGGPYLSAVVGKSEVRGCAHGLASPAGPVGLLAWPNWAVLFPFYIFVPFPFLFLLFVKSLVPK